jgi:hypothetical protein
VNIRRHLDRAARADRRARDDAILARARRVGFLGSDRQDLAEAHAIWCAGADRPFVQIDGSTVYLTTMFCSWCVSRRAWELLVRSLPPARKVRRDDEEFFVYGVPAQDRGRAAWRLLEMALDCRPTAFIEG